MKVLVVWKNFFNYLQGIASAFDSLPQVAGKSFNIEQFQNQAKGYERVLTKQGINYFKYNYTKQMTLELLNECKKYNPNLILFLNADGTYRDIIEGEFLSFIKKNNVKIAIWFIDSLKTMRGYNKEYLEKFNGLYSFESDDLAYAQKTYCIDNIKYLPLGADQKIYGFDTEETVKKYDVCFVGGADSKRLTILNKIALFCKKNNKTMIVFGYMWKHRPIWRRIRHERMFRKKYPFLYSCVVNSELAPKKISELYASSKICLNIVRSVHDGANPRTFEILATKSFQMVDYSEKIEMLFEDKKHLVMYKDTDELERLLDYYLNHDEEREQIAQAGHDLVMEKYTLTKLVAQIVEDMKEK